MPNALAQASSPYLLQHQDNPVDWQEWNEAALARARAENRPILLSIGYAACHWCHVMAHESFENPEIAAVMNRHFVNIKVDREERPDLDTVYQQALALMGQQGGWPLTMFLTPEGGPFWGGTYFPPEPRYGRPGFPQLLEQVAELYRQGNDRITSNRTALVQALQRLSSPQAGGLPTPDLARRVARELAEQFDTIHGGLGAAPKFPQAPLLRLIWDVGLRTRDPVLRRRTLHTLSRIAQGGIYDHLGGGFARYSVDAAWLVPHFEKMLYDNAQLLSLLGSAWAATGDPLFKERAEETVGWLTREMMVDGAFASSLDADSEGEEGRFYVWDAAEIDRLLGEDAAMFRLAYGVTAGGNWEGHNILHRLHEPSLPGPEEAERLRRCREILMVAREKRVRPGRDDKVLADWNGLTIAALAETAGLLDRPDWLDLARGAFEAVRRHMSEGDRLFHSWRAGRRLPMAFLDDYAQMSRAALALFQATGEKPFLDRAQAWIERCQEEFADPEGGGWFMAPAASDGPVVRPKSAHDGPTPAAVGTLADVLATLWHLTGEDRYRQRAEATLEAFSGDAQRSLHSHATLLLAANMLAEATQVVIVGDEATPGRTELLRTAAAAPWPGRILFPVRTGAGLPSSHPAAGKHLLGGRAAAYVCVGGTCEAPLADAEALRRRLAA